MIRDTVPASSSPSERIVHVVQGEQAIVGEDGIVLSTILGSCVATCLHDPIARVGGMNHFLLPGDTSANAADDMKYGVNAMELLINGLLQRGASRARLEAKLFGGAHVVGGLSDIGAQNGAFARRFLQTEGIQIVGASLGGDRARRVRYWPCSGRASQLLLDKADVFTAERKSPPKPAAPEAGAVELF
ncbi:MAG TPA: chemotaxis protein CheD [Vitreimonas sp.]|uniref:chemotaxis protein CheD n=1 Tax=Vitreimonas sp. TaxID=3069702 RepID=UPI002D519D9A|nr:chemotaxis protein CheD [Vitreimonas sp.]HYD88811.1 chemotaxis protein CheD [Vitreimonas sp.]